jgi:RND family efflux transporter MFP subunit
VWKSNTSAILRTRSTDREAPPLLLRILVPLLLIAASIGGAVVMLLTRPEAKEAEPELARLLVEVIEVNPGDVTVTVESRGTVAARTRTSLVSEVTGRILSVAEPFVAGGFFREGDVLLRIDPRNYETAVTQAEAAVARARTAVEQERALARYAKEDFDRARELAAVRGDQATALTLREPQLAQARAELASAEAALVQAREDLARTVLRAPYDGLVREKLADVGQYVNPGTPVAELFAVDYAEVRLPLTAEDLAFLDLPETFGAAPASALPVTLRAQLGGEARSWPARLVRTEGVFDTRTRVLYAVAQIQDPYGLDRTWPQGPLRIGTFVTAEVQGSVLRDVYTIPRHALRPGERLWLVDEQERLARAQVEVVRADERRVYVRGGLEPGDRVALTPLEDPLPGAPVRVLQDGADS